MSLFNRTTIVVLLALQLGLLSACAPGLKVKSNTEVEIPPNQIPVQAPPEGEIRLARR